MHNRLYHLYLTNEIETIDRHWLTFLLLIIISVAFITKEWTDGDGADTSAYAIAMMHYNSLCAIVSISNAQFLWMNVPIGTEKFETETPSKRLRERERKRRVLVLKKSVKISQARRRNKSRTFTETCSEAMICWHCSHCAIAESREWTKTEMKKKASKLVARTDWEKYCPVVSIIALLMNIYM